MDPTLIDKLAGGSPLILAFLVVAMVFGQLIPKILHDALLNAYKTQLEQCQRDGREQLERCQQDGREWKELTKEATQALSELRETVERMSHEQRRRS